MNRTGSIDNTIRQYLLGELSEPEQAAIESEYFADKERFEEVCALENDLIDDYVRGNLSAAERERFERHYCSSPERISRVQFAGSMLSSLYGVPARAAAKTARPESGRAGFLRALAFRRARLTAGPVLAGLALILVVAVALLGVECLRLNKALTTSRRAIASQAQREEELERQLAEQRADNNQLGKELDAVRSQQTKEQNNPPEGKPSPIVAAFTLRLGLIRGSSEPQVLTVAPGADVIELRLDLRSVDFKKYSATLTTPEGTVVWKQAGVRVLTSQTGGRIAIRVPARLLPAGDYVLRVDGMSSSSEAVEASASYFRVARQAAH